MPAAAGLHGNGPTTTLAPAWIVATLRLGNSSPGTQASGHVRFGSATAMAAGPAPAMKTRTDTGPEACIPRLLTRTYTWLILPARGSTWSAAGSAAAFFAGVP